MNKLNFIRLLAKTVRVKLELRRDNCRGIISPISLAHLRNNPVFHGKCYHEIKTSVVIEEAGGAIAPWPTSAATHSLRSRGRAACMRLQGNHMLGHLGKMHERTHFLAANTCSSQVTQGLAQRSLFSSSWSVWLDFHSK